MFSFFVWPLVFPSEQGTENNKKKSLKKRRKKKIRIFWDSIYKWIRSKIDILLGICEPNVVPCALCALGRYIISFHWNLNALLHHTYVTQSFHLSSIARHLRWVKKLYQIHNCVLGSQKNRLFLSFFFFCFFFFLLLERDY